MKDFGNTAARSRTDGIVFYSTRRPWLGITSIVTEEGEIIAEPSIVILQDFIGAFTEMDKKLSRKAFIIINICLCIISIIASICMKNPWITFGTIYFVILASEYFFDLIPFAFQLKLGNKKMKRLGRFHAAEHKVRNAYRALNYKRMPTREEVQKASRFSKYCGSRFAIRKLILYTTISIVIVFLGPSSHIYFTSLIILLIVVLLDTKYNILLFTQVLVTNKPTDTEIDVAMEGFRKYLEFEEIMENGTNEDREKIYNNMYIFF